MIVAHLSELHLGFRRWGRTQRGRNVREGDVAAAFERAVHALERAGPDLVVVVGDIFDRPRPGPTALLALARGLDALRSALPHAPVVLVAGARDTPLSPGEPGILSVVEGRPGVEVASGTLHVVDVASLDLALALVPYRAGLQAPYPVPEPDPDRRWNVLAAYGRTGTVGGVSVDPARWSYVALGGSHVHRQVAERAAYSGSLERVGHDPWSEGAEEKGYLLVDLATGRHRFRSVPIRPVVSLAPIRRPQDLAALPARVREVTDEVPGGLDRKVVRLRFRDTAPRELLGLQGALLAKLRDQALHLELDASGPLDRRGLPRLRDFLGPRLYGGSGGAGDVPPWAPDPDRPPQVIPGLPDRIILRAGEGEAGEANEADEADGAGEANEADGADGARGVELREGLLLVVADDPSTTADLLHRLAPTDGDGPGTPWLRPDRRSPEALAGAVVDLLVRTAGAQPLLDEVRRRRETGASTGGPREPRREMERRLGELRGAEDELRDLEDEIRSLREDHAEVAGDLEVAVMGWMRERQDAETHLHAYRDRARELKGRIERLEEGGGHAPCPTCGRTLGGLHDEVMGALKEEWEAVVQDGSWWRRRREQLELKPEPLQELEGTAVRLQAAVEACAERLEAVRSRVRERDEIRGWIELHDRGMEPAVPVRSGTPRLREGGAGLPLDRIQAALAELRAAVEERLLDRASSYAGRITSSRLLALTRTKDGHVRLEGIRGPVATPGDGDLAVAAVCVLLAGLSLQAEEVGAVPGAVLPEALVEAMPDEERLALLDLLAFDFRERVRTILVVARPSTAEGRPELPDAVLDLRTDTGSGLPRWRSAGESRLLLSPPRRAGASEPPPYDRPAPGG